MPRVAFETPVWPRLQRPDYTMSAIAQPFEGPSNAGRWPQDSSLLPRAPFFLSCRHRRCLSGLRDRAEDGEQMGRFRWGKDATASAAGKCLSFV
ncbi:hypothetical protein DPEC_G00352010 [Dallia pectoralis]|uniref:Uncharacterized protein n=1 Tax=Dallia pectoralis TaxID=75939 RepID=A0ACC2F234_DALPE|nr:hypothetical protein DPEC_G00352010 [Dallia pectoralis]